MKKLFLVLLFISIAIACSTTDSDNGSNDPSSILEDENILLSVKLATLKYENQLWKEIGTRNDPAQPITVFKKFFQDGVVDNAKVYLYFTDCWQDFNPRISSTGLDDIIITDEDAFSITYKITTNPNSSDLNILTLENGEMDLITFDDYNGENNYSYVQITEQEVIENSDYESEFPLCDF